MGAFLILTSNTPCLSDISACSIITGEGRGIARTDVASGSTPGSLFTGLRQP